jgi:hypothetical protein
VFLPLAHSHLRVFYFFTFFAHTHALTESDIKAAHCIESASKLLQSNDNICSLFLGFVSSFSFVQSDRQRMP